MLDASIAIAWSFEDEESDYAYTILEGLGPDEAVVPTIWPLEVSNALVGAHRRGRVSAADVASVRQLLATVPVSIDDASLDRSLGPVFEVARTYGLSSYDASYLELAMREGLPLATLDARLREAALEAGIALV